jgi:hypothetical protein
VCFYSHLSNPYPSEEGKKELEAMGEWEGKENGGGGEFNYIL